MTSSAGGTSASVDTGQGGGQMSPGAGGSTTSAETSETEANGGPVGGRTGSGRGGSQANEGTGSGQTSSGQTNGGTGGAQTDVEAREDQTNATGGEQTSGGAGGVPTDVETGVGETNESDGGSEGKTGSGGDDTGVNEPEVTVFLAGDDVNSNGPLDTTLEENLSFSGGGHILVRPTNITAEPNTKHPVAIWGPGGGTPPGDYMQLLTRMASQGFVVVGIRESTGDSALMSAAIDWLEQQNADSNSPMYDRLILDRVGVFGHSMGGLSSEAAAQEDDRVATALLNNSGSFSHDALVNVMMPVGLIYGETGQERPNSEGDFNNSGNQGPVWLAMMLGGGHGSGPWDGAGANVAWMRWHLGGENVRKNAFLGDGGAYNDTGIWVTDFKNWDDWKNWNE